MLNYKFANKLNLPWDCDNSLEKSSLSLWLLLDFEKGNLSPSPSPFFAPTDCGKEKTKQRSKKQKKPNPDLNMLNYKFANKLNLPWDCDNGSEKSSLSLWLLLDFEKDSLSPSPSPFFAPTDCGIGS